MMRNNILQWVVLTVIAVAALAACNQDNSSSDTSNTPDATSSMATNTQPGAQDAAPGDSLPSSAAKESLGSPGGEEIYAKSNCAMCHGGDQAGTKLGPALSELTSNGWDAAKLQLYLRDPKDHSVNPERLAALDGDYSMSMPAFTGNDTELSILVEWLLSK